MTDERSWIARLHDALSEDHAECCDVPGGPERCGDCPRDRSRPQYVPEPITLEKLAEIVKKAATQGMGGYPDESLLRLAQALQDARSLE